MYHASFQHKKWKTNWCHCFNFIHISTDLYMFWAHRSIFRKTYTAVPTTNGSVSVSFWSWPERYGYWTNGCGNSCTNSPKDGPVGPKYVEIRRYMNKIETVTSIGLSFLKPWRDFPRFGKCNTKNARKENMDLRWINIRDKYTTNRSSKFEMVTKN